MPFATIIGHEKQIGFLKEMIRQRRLPHALLFFGPEGVGKRQVAFAFAQAVNCPEFHEDTCGKCQSCRKIAHNCHPDVVALKPVGQFIKIQAIRELKGQTRFKPWEGGKRVILIDEAHKMNEEAANALLKLLEEPPADNIFLLVTSRADKIPATILSRCQQVRFSPLTEENLRDYLKKECSLDDKEAKFIAAASGGSIAKAREICEEGYLKTRKDLKELLLTLRGATRGERLCQIHRLGEDQEGIRKTLEIMMTFMRDILVYKETGRGINLINRDWESAVEIFSRDLSVEDVLFNLEVIDHALKSIESHGDKSLTLELMMLRLKM